ncbi:MAG: branched-chain-amino-acid transaminase [Phycisphaerales bacterium]|nr:branched-chain-amino-acid transaminase [Phycisphaerales bacterium]
MSSHSDNTMNNAGSESPAATLSKGHNAKSSLKIWLDGEFLDHEKAVVSVFDHGLLYGDGCFEGIRIYNGRIFKLRTHLERMFRSAELLRLKSPYTIDEIEAACRESVVVNEIANGYIRLVFTRGVGGLGLNPFLCDKPTVFIISDSIQLYPAEMYETGLRVVMAERRRFPINCLDPSIKSLNYLNNIMAKVEAIDQGVLEAIMLNNDGHISEGTGDNIFIVKDKAILTPSTEAGILHGITRQYVMEELAPAIGFEVEERMMYPQHILEADEVFLTGTACEIIGVTHLDDQEIGAGQVGPITKSLEAEFRKRVENNAPED